MIHSHDERPQALRRPTLVSLPFTFSLILSISPCQCRTVQTNSSLVWSPFVTAPHYLQEIPTSSAFLTNKHALIVKASLPAWPARLAKTSATQLSSLGSWHSVSLNACFFIQQVTDSARIVAKRKTLFDDRPVEISVRGVPSDSMLCQASHSIINLRNSHLLSSKTLQILTRRLLCSRRM
jgi:hypothetical protein